MHSQGCGEGGGLLAASFLSRRCGARQAGRREPAHGPPRGYQRAPQSLQGPGTQTKCASGRGQPRTQGSRGTLHREVRGSRSGCPPSSPGPRRHERRRWFCTNQAVERPLMSCTPCERPASAGHHPDNIEVEPSGLRAREFRRVARAASPSATKSSRRRSRAVRERPPTGAPAPGRGTQNGESRDEGRASGPEARLSVPQGSVASSRGQRGLGPSGQAAAYREVLFRATVDGR